MEQLLDGDEFGPMMQAEFYKHESNELETLKQKVNELMEAKRIAEAEFSQQRGKFMEIFKQKEDELRQTCEQLSVVRSQNSNKDSEISRLQKCLQELSTEVSDVKTSAAIAEADRLDEMEKMQRKYRDDLASLQSIIKEFTLQADQTSNAKYEQEIAKLTRQRDKLESELQDTRSKQHRDREGILTSLTKTLQKRVGNVDPRESDEENLEYSMRRAQEDTEKLRTLIAPFEEEISSLKSQLKHCQEHITLLESEELERLLETSRRQQHSIAADHQASDDQTTDVTDAVSSTSAAADVNENPSQLEGIKRREWDAIHRKLELASRQAKRPCDECEKKQLEIKSLQDNEKQTNDSLSTLKHLLENEKQSRLQLEKYKESLEKNLNSVAMETQKQLSTLMTRVMENERFLELAKKRFSGSKKQLQEQMNAMATYRDDLQAELTRLQDENDELVGKRSRFAQEIQEEFINLPDNIEDMQVVALKYREELIAAKVGKEHAESALQRDTETVRSQLAQAAAKERNLSQEINKLREELAIRNSLYSELEQRLNDSETLKTISALQIELSDCKMAKSNVERTVHQLQSRIDSLKTDLTDSEAIQKEFVQFSQKLQIELDKVHRSEREVRWQHPDDILECESCRKPFERDSVEKENCHHCGHIFCKDCLTQSLPSGPNHRLVTVCLTCYQILSRVQGSSAPDGDEDIVKDC